MPETYQDALDFLYGRLNYERTGMPRVPSELRLGRMRRLLRRLGDPQDAYPIVHVAGTKGKGSTAALMASALSAAGIRTGLFCSPHLHRLEERFRLDGREATPEQLRALVEVVRPVVERLDLDDPHPRRRPLTFFEITTALGLLHFARSGAGAVLLEVGMGGRLDSTNAIRPALAVITSISLDHTRQLGSTTSQIAREKAGILKRGRTAVIGVRDPDARAVIRQVSDQRRAPLRVIDIDFGYSYHPPSSPLTEPTAGRVTVQTWRTDWGPIPLPLLGPHQALNAAVALAGFDALAESGPIVDRAAVVRGFATLEFPARIEVLGRSPWLVIDGAHNVASALALAETLRTCFPPVTRRTLVFGTTREKDLIGQLRALLPDIDEVIATRYIENPRAVPPLEVAATVSELSDLPVSITDDPATALALARDRTPPDGLIVVTGSLFLAAEARALILNDLAAPAPA